ncbi:hypothetical protein GOPIP_054_00680 [Gordonia polyisoprenivorans NBRC 16320 = JCM 10675]|uniref:Dihydroorotate dehydrogenase n=1 Tax=Gordonia polyisoprenivorans TaxID=84595 RepID=A0A846WM33_9ACTN|nr:DUF5703 family protein [Gordonia polyisoprenivorans]NKY02369.1 hypothetical protein [Gordonia polyisoprenivorans]WCB39628.1 DUF5703 family protein [Gordonia polyisoprenivorans]GAB23503.1 hypothetical protein GOPIP_054_00680 [Gordonia polyisoprenivorans NBRC 16320 = JCM 10675]
MTRRPGQVSVGSGRAGVRNGARYPRGWEVTSEDYECLLVRLPPDVTRVTASMRLSLEAEFGGWELSRVRLYSDGTRKVLLKRRRAPRDHGPDIGAGTGTGTENTRNSLSSNGSQSDHAHPEHGVRAC